MDIPNIDTYEGWCGEVVKHIIKLGVPAKQVRDDMEGDAEWYSELFEDGMFPEQAAKLASDHLL
ncbi:hypothetical protein [Massilia phyllosphaerae]|uniref:hypothetical protein n=1 Tax=Massilia phyllosphaerae TaxID=3106034 RepID=UPI002B1CD0B6|nr:hypothetical protein [Massilia sp. SGZ-792]